MQIYTKGVLHKPPLCGKGDPQGIVQEIKISPCLQIVNAKIRIYT